MREEKFHEEVQMFHWIFNLLFLLPVLSIVWVFVQHVIFGIPFGKKPAENIVLLLLAFLFILIPLVFGRMVTVVNEKEIRVSFGYLGWIRKRIPVSEIQKVEVVTYRPLRQFGGWGIRSGRFRGERVGCYSIKGNKGVLLSLSNDSRVCLVKVKKLIIGSQVPEKLFDALVKQGI